MKRITIETSYKTVNKKVHALVKTTFPEVKTFKRFKVEYIGSVTYYYDEKGEMIAHASKRDNGYVIIAQNSLREQK